MSDDLTTSISLLSEAATRAENTTTFFDDVTTGGTDETVTNPNNSIEVPTVQKQIYDLYTEDGTTIAAQDAQEAAEAAQAAAETAQAAAEAAEASTVEISGIDTVYDAIGLVSPANIQWDVEIPFNDSLNIARGYGTYDQIDVSADQDESIMVDLTTKSVDFSRASTTGSINKSGVFETLDEDEPIIGSDGLGVFGSYTNSITYTDFDGGYPTGSATQWTSTTEVDGVTFGYFESDSVSFKDLTYTADSSFSYSVYLYKNDSTSYQLVRSESRGEATRVCSIYYDWDSRVAVEGTVSSGWSYKITELSLDVVKVSLIYDSSIESLGNTTARIAYYPMYDSSLTTDGNYGYYGGMQLVVGLHNYDLPFTSTGSVESTRSADVPSVQNLNNLPASGNSFSIRFNASVPEYTDGTISIIRIFGGELNFIRRVSSGIQWLWSDVDSSSISAVVSGVDDSEHVFCMVYNSDDETISLYVDGEGVSTSYPTSNSGGYDSSSYIQIGVDHTFTVYALNSYVKDFKIVHEALSDSQIAALGSAS